MSSPEKKRNKQLPSPSPESTPNPSLPNDLLLSCFARISRLHYPTLSLVSKSFRSLLASSELYKTRSIINRTETCLYVYLDFSHHDPNPNGSWFTLCKKPTQNLTNNTKNKKSGGYVLAPVPITDSSFDDESSLVAVGSNIYAIGGKEPSTKVLILDCRSHTWQEAPRMRVPRRHPVASVLDGKIYVAGGGFNDLDSSNWMEVFDTKTQTWEHVLSPLAEICSSNIFNSTVVEGEIYMFGDNDVANYKPKEDRWEALGDGEHQNIDLGYVSYSDHCVIDNVIYCFRYSVNVIKYYDSKVGYWKKLTGLEGLSKFSSFANVKLADYGGKMAILMDFIGYKINTIWCAVISLEKRSALEIWGKVESLDIVLIVPNTYSKIYASAVTL